MGHNPDMPGSESTRWTVIRDAAEGNVAARALFARRYEPVVRAYLSARWHHGPVSAEKDDAVQEVFVECFREGGALEAVDSQRPGGFGAFFYGVMRNVARRYEAARRQARARVEGEAVDLDGIEADEETLSRVFDRAWASVMLKEAAWLQAEQARGKGDDAVRRVDLLTLRFEEGLPIREIARRWEVEPDWLHHQYARARDEYKKALKEVVSENHGVGGAALEEECRRLLQFFQ
jgi:RNA polymerase sigma-70 factor (ECF subfamily)